MSKTKTKGRTRNKFLILLADLILYNSHHIFFTIFIQLSRYVDKLKTSTVWVPVSGHKRRKHVFHTSEGLQSAEFNTESNFSIQKIGVKLTAA